MALLYVEGEVVPLNFDEPQRERRLGVREEGKKVVEREDKLEDLREEQRDEESLRHSLRKMGAVNMLGSYKTDRSRIERYRKNEVINEKEKNTYYIKDAPVFVFDDAYNSVSITFTLDNNSHNIFEWIQHGATEAGDRSAGRDHPR